MAVHDQEFPVERTREKVDPRHQENRGRQTVACGHVLLAPPFIISDNQIDELVGKFSGAIETALAN